MGIRFTLGTYMYESCSVKRGLNYLAESIGQCQSVQFAQANMSRNFDIYFSCLNQFVVWQYGFLWIPNEVMSCLVWRIMEIHLAPFCHNKTHIWLATLEKGHSDICAMCYFRSACADCAG